MRDGVYDYQAELFSQMMIGFRLAFELIACICCYVGVEGRGCGGDAESCWVCCLAPQDYC